MGCTVCTEPQCLYSRAIPLLPLRAVRPVQSPSACTVELYLYSPYGPYGLYRASVPVQYSYTTTPPMGRTACTEPQCLYKGALYFYFYPIQLTRQTQFVSYCCRHSDRRFCTLKRFQPEATFLSEFNYSPTRNTCLEDFQF